MVAGYQCSGERDEGREGVYASVGEIFWADPELFLIASQMLNQCPTKLVFRVGA